MYAELKCINIEFFPVYPNECCRSLNSRRKGKNIPSQISPSMVSVPYPFSQKVPFVVMGRLVSHALHKS